MAKCSVALCITDLESGGAEQAMVELATRLDWNRFEPVVYCLRPRPESDEASCVPLLEDAGIEFHFLDARSIRHFRPTVERLEQLLRRQNPALLQSFLFHANLVGRIAARRAGVRLVLSGLRVAEPRRWHRWIDRLTCRWVDRYVCVSDAVARFAQRRIGLPPEKLTVIPNGIDAEKYSAVPPVDLASLGVPPGRRVIAYVGRLDKQKGIQWLLKTSPEWLRHLPDCHLLIVGKGPLEKTLRRACLRLGVEPRVSFAGWRPDVPEILAASQLLVLPSRWEGMPNIVLQAMASGLPVVASDVEGVRELLGHQSDAQVVPYGNSRELTEKIVAILSDPVRASHLGNQNRHRAEQEFTFDRMVAAYQNLWYSLLSA